MEICCYQLQYPSIRQSHGGVLKIMQGDKNRFLTNVLSPGKDRRGWQINSHTYCMVKRYLQCNLCSNSQTVHRLLFSDRTSAGRTKSQQPLQTILLRKAEHPCKINTWCTSLSAVEGLRQENVGHKTHRLHLFFFSSVKRVKVKFKIYYFMLSLQSPPEKSYIYLNDFMWYRLVIHLQWLTHCSSAQSHFSI